MAYRSSMAFEERHLRVGATAEVGDRRMKWYHLSVGSAPIQPAIVEVAQRYLPYLMPPLDGTPPAGFAVLHQGLDAVYLLAYTWVWDNVIHCRSASAGSAYLGSVEGNPYEFRDLRNASWMGCVWELAIVAHERDAWVRHLLAPGEPDLDGYLADSLKSLMVGAPT
jgi:hypothetical protein